MNLSIPVPEGINQEIRKMFLEVGNEVIKEIKERELRTKDYMTMTEACQYIGVSFVTLQKLQRLGLKIITIDSKKLVAKDTIDEFLKTYEA